MFLPTAFMTGLVGRFFKQFGWTAAVAVFLLLALLAAFVLTQGKDWKPLLLAAIGGIAGFTSASVTLARPDPMAPWIGAQVTLKGYWDGQFLNLDDPRARVALAPRWPNCWRTAMPSAAEIEVEECAAPNGSYSLSERLVKPDSPPPWRSVRMRSRRPVRILCG